VRGVREGRGAVGWGGVVVGRVWWVGWVGCADAVDMVGLDELGPIRALGWGESGRVRGGWVGVGWVCVGWGGRGVRGGADAVVLVG